MNFIKNIPEDIYYQIVGYLSIDDQKQAEKVNRTWCRCVAFCVLQQTQQRISNWMSWAKHSCSLQNLPLKQELPDKHLVLLEKSLGESAIIGQKPRIEEFRRNFFSIREKARMLSYLFPATTCMKICLMKGFQEYLKTAPIRRLTIDNVHYGNNLVIKTLQQIPSSTSEPAVYETLLQTHTKALKTPLKRKERQSLIKVIFFYFYVNLNPQSALHFLHIQLPFVTTIVPFAKQLLNDKNYILLTNLVTWIYQGSEKRLYAEAASIIESLLENNDSSLCALMDIIHDDLTLKYLALAYLDKPQIQNNLFYTMVKKLPYKSTLEVFFKSQSTKHTDIQSILEEHIIKQDPAFPILKH